MINEYKMPEEIMSILSDTDVLYMVKNNYVKNTHLNKIKYGSTFTDEEVASWLNLNVKTYRSYKKSSSDLKPDIQEHIIKLLSLIKHGAEVFGSVSAFSEWLETDHLFLDWKKPTDFLNTISGIAFIDRRLTGIEYGDNA